MGVPSRISIITLGWRRRPESQGSVTSFDDAGSAPALDERTALAQDAPLDPGAEPQPGVFREATCAIDVDDDVLADPDGRAWDVAHDPDLTSLPR